MPQVKVDQSHRVFVAVGSNLEPRVKHIQDALRSLADIAEVVRISPVYETAPVGYADQPDFLNAALEIRTTDGPFELLAELKAIERRLGRQQRPRWHEREIDFDIVFFDDLVLSSSELTIPHPELHRRAFVLIPMRDLDANFVHPVLHRTIDDLAKDLDDQGIRRSSFSLAR